MSGDDVSTPLRLYWQPGCSSCVRTKEFLQKRGVTFESVNVAHARAKNPRSYAR